MLRACLGESDACFVHDGGVEGWEAVIEDC